MSRYEINQDNLVNHPRPSIPDRFQKELNRIGGLNDYGKPKIILAWAPEVTRIAYGRPRKQFLAAVVKRMTHWLEKKIDGSEAFHPPTKAAPFVEDTSLLFPVYEEYDLAKQRWVIMEWWAPELVCVDWEANRWKFENGKQIDVTGPAPKEGQYRPLYILETEEGLYREPNDQDIEEIRRLAWMRQLEPQKFSNREVQNDPKAIAREAQILSEYQQQVDTEAAEAARQRLKESLAPHVDKLIENPEAAWGGRGFVGGGK